MASMQIELKEVLTVFKKRDKNTHKGDYGRVLISGGSTGMSGAPFMSGEAAKRSGAGLVCIAAPRCINEILEMKTCEVMTLPVDDRKGGFSKRASKKVLEMAQKSDFTAFGMGAGKTKGVQSVLKTLARDLEKPLLIDADGLNILSENMHFLRLRKGLTVVTPHFMEMQRLTGLNLDYISENTKKVCVEFASDYNVITVLKGADTVVSSPDGRFYVNTGSGNPGMATGGSGDVLNGITAAFCAKSADPFLSVCAAVYIHGLAGDMACKKYGEDSMCAADIINMLPKAIKSIKAIKN